MVQRRVHGDDAAKRPANPQRARERRSNRRGTNCRLAKAVFVITRAVSWKVNQMQSEPRFELSGQRRKYARMHRPAMDQDDIRPIPDRLDVHVSASLRGWRARRQAR